MLFFFFLIHCTSPDFLGNVEIDLTTLVQSKRRQANEVLFKNQAFPLMNGKGTITFDIELGWENIYVEADSQES